MIWKFGNVRVDVGGIVFLTALMAFCVWYLFDARAASTSPQNLVLIQPAVIVAGILYLFILREFVTIGSEAEAPAETTAWVAADDEEEATFNPGWGIQDLRIVAFIALMAVYVFAMLWLPFDLVTLLFIAFSLLLQGERRLLVVVLVPLVFTAGIVYMLKSTLSIPVPTLFG